MALNIKTFTTLVQDQAAAIQAAASVVVDFATGSVMRALVQSNAAIALWLESLAVRVLSLTRAATSAGSDLDSWMADFGLIRLGNLPAKGTVTFNRFSVTAAGFVPVGAQVQTTDGSQLFTVLADPTNSAFNPATNGYTLAINVASLGILCQANVAGSAGNVGTGTITVIFGAIPGIDFVSNAAPMAGGVDPESDGAFRARFVSFLQSLSKGTKAAIGAAVAAVQPGVGYIIVEDLTLGALTQQAFFYVVVDDGSGNPPASFVTACTNAVESVRSAGINYAVYGATTLTANVVMAITTDPTYVHATVTGIVQAALTKFINGLGLGNGQSAANPLPFYKLAQIAFEASPGVTGVSGVTLNAGTADLVPTGTQVVRAGTITVS